MSRVSLSAACMLLTLPVFAADSRLVVDRGLPQSNLNNASGSARSNVRWGSDDQGFLGDDFTIGASGEYWVIDSIRTWSVPGSAATTRAYFGDYYQNVQLHFGHGDVSPVATAQLTPGTNLTSSPDIRVSDASQNGTILYDDFGTPLPVWQIDFTNLNLQVDGGVRYSFGVSGGGRPVPGGDGKVFTWYNHASNAALSGTRQDGADGRMLVFDASGKAQDPKLVEGQGWDKNADINVQIFAHRVEKRATSRTTIH
jgi:hypothetical protein